ncbi:hypothetical protein [Tenacibaculum soleae]|nr:hypothetical protein [Tenacibaculum soleae]
MRVEKVYYFNKSYLHLSCFSREIGLGFSVSKKGFSILIAAFYIGFYYR